VGQQPLRHLLVANSPVSRMRLRIEAIEGDDVVEAAFVSEALQERKVTGRDAAVAAEELRRGWQRPETLEVEGAVPEELLHGLVHLLVGPLEGDSPRSERNGERVDDTRRLVHTMWLADNDEACVGERRSRSVDRVVVECKRVEPIFADSGPEVTRRRHDHETRLVAAN
jgi:hypothetical protein